MSREGVCLCGHGPDDHCTDGECISGGVAGDGVSFACGCQDWRTAETEAKKRAAVADMAAWYRAQGNEEAARLIEGGRP